MDGRDGSDTTETLTVEVAGSLGEVDRAQWDALANPGWRMDAAGRLVDTGATAFNPFVSHAFLQALEEAGCVGGASGWHPRHLLVRDPSGRLVAAAPAYLKTHSRGEYVFDHGWADAIERAGGSYYPKLQVCVPFTPAQGPRLLVGEEERQTRRAFLSRALVALAQTVGASSVHVTFALPEEIASMTSAGYLPRLDTQFHFTNRGYTSPDDFLAALASRKRKQVRRERRAALGEGVTVRWLTGEAITEAHWDAFFAFYMDTGARKWGRPYLNRTFFSLLGERLGHRICLVLAERAGRPIAGALNLVGSETLYGRYWGCLEDRPFLHFEVCYYQAIDYAIAHGLARVEAGAQGEHKLARGYEAVETRSGHYLRHPALRRAVADFLGEERRAVSRQNEVLNAYAPFRKGG